MFFVRTLVGLSLLVVTVLLASAFGVKTSSFGCRSDTRVTAGPPIGMPTTTGGLNAQGH